MSKYIYLDTETTGIGEDDRLFEVAYIAGELEREALYTPSNGPFIPLSAQAVTDVTNDMIVGKPLFKESPEYSELQTLLEDHILVAHNAPFDVGMLEREGIKVHRYIDTLKLAYLIPNAESVESHKLNYLRHWYQIPNSGGALHRALTDTEYLRGVFEKMRAELNMTDEEMMRVTQQPARQIYCKVGKKHYGQKWSEVPKSYLKWIVEESDFEGDVKANAQLHLNGQMSLV